MKKLTASLTLFTLLLSGIALVTENAAAAPDAETQAQKEARQEKKHFKGKNKKPRPRFEDCDKDKDSSLSLEEFLACHPKGGEAGFAAIDADRDGKITRDEMVTFFEEKKAQKRQALFKRCDTDGDGMLSFEEFSQCKPEPKDKRNFDHNTGLKKSSPSVS